MAAPLRQQLWGLARLLRQQQLAAQYHPLQAIAGSLAAGAGGSATWMQQAAALHSSRPAAALGGGGITGWFAEKLLGIPGSGEVEDLDMETFASTLKNARRLGGLTGFVHGTSAINDHAAVGTMRLFEQIIEAMTDGEKKNLQLFDAAARQRVAAQVGCTTNQVDDCIARYLWMRQLTQQVAKLKKEGKEMPKTVDELEHMLGNWRQYKSESERADGTASAAVPLSHIGYKGQPCPLAGQPVGRSTKCPASKKAFKACCGKKLALGA